ncbi:lysoplasmalogenase [Phaeobacter sp. PT47_59]|uniref:lysoplasmalogenase n=1 Tax=Phaeobacter sp. PT47_59 TaxID=3029979 RepID=UPI0023803B2F|nr:lysoplasmalogenase [Phaeobacter sp. PT47_59]MDE4173487.1 lysoplasmalogenase [Phaeobacter sp. PT47_59]
MDAMILLVAAGCAFAYLFFTARPEGLLRSVLKTASVALLALLAILSDAPLLLGIGLLLCAIGDYCLSREGEGAFMAGVGAFAAGHLAYVGLFLTTPGREFARLGQMPGLGVVLGLAVLGLVMVRVLAPRAGALKGAVLAYIPIILSMGAAAATLPMEGALAWALPAALAFIVSDVVLAFENFVLPDGHPLRRIAPYAVWPLYWGAQIGFFFAFW